MIVNIKNDPNFKVERDKKGNIVRADGIGQDGVPIRLTVVGVPGVSHTSRSAISNVEIVRNNSMILRVTTEISPAERVIRFSAKGNGVDVKWTLDVSDAKQPSIGTISGSINGRHIEAPFDPYFGIGKSDIDLGLRNWLPSQFEDQLTPLQPLVAMLSDHPLLPENLDVGAGTVALSKGIGTTACKILGGLGAAATCGGTFGLGCGLGIIAFAIVEDVCETVVTSPAGTTPFDGSGDTDFNVVIEHGTIHVPYTPDRK